MSRRALALLILAVALLPFALLMGGFRGLSLVGVLLVSAAIVLTIVGAPRSNGGRS